MLLHKYSLEEWKEVAKDAHVFCHNENRDPEMNTFDYALGIFKENKEIAGYATIIEMDKKTAYIQHGGSFPSALGTIISFRGYSSVINYLRKNYDRATTRIKNTNRSMLMFALREGFLIIGIDYYEDGHYLHLLNEFKKDDKCLSQ